VFDSDPKSLVEKLIKMVQKQKSEENLVYNNHDGWKGDGEYKNEVIL
jgi:hypothetical protein